MKLSTDIENMLLVACVLVFAVLIMFTPRAGGQELDPAVTQYTGNTITFSADNHSDAFSHPQFTDYCRLAEKAFSGSEGSSVHGYNLKKVFLLLSPGQRALSINFENITSPSYSCDFEVFAKSSNHEKVKDFPEVADIYKHMQSKKGGFKIYQPYPKKPVCNDEELTPLGITQLILLGEYLGNRYSKLRFHEPSRSSRLVSAYSIHNEAAYQSMFAFLHGILHEKNLVQTYVRKSPYNFCSRFPKQTCECPKTEYLQDEISKGVRKGFHMFKNTAKVNRNINEKLKIPRHTEMAPREIVSFLSTWICDARTHPCLNGACLNISVSNLDGIFQSANDYLNHLTSSDIFQSYARLITYPFFETLFQWMGETQQEKMTAFVSEEEFLLMAMSTLGLPTDAVLSQASRLVFEVHESLDERMDDLILKVYLNGLDVTDKLSVNKDLNGSSLSVFSVINYYQNLFMGGFKNRDFDEECLF